MVLSLRRRQLRERAAPGAAAGRLQPPGGLVPWQAQHPCPSRDPQPRVQVSRQGEQSIPPDLDVCISISVIHVGLFLRLSQAVLFIWIPWTFSKVHC